MKRRPSENSKKADAILPEIKRHGQCVREQNLETHHDNRRQNEQRVQLETSASKVRVIFSSIHHFDVTALAITVITLALRVYYVTDRRNWVVIHPDEIFQSIEVGHTEHFGYGFQPYEFSPPIAAAATAAATSHDIGTNGTSTAAHVTRYRQMELEAGLSALRSPIVPYFYALVAACMSAVGVTGNPYMIFRFSHVTVTSALPFSVYAYCKNLFASRDIGILAAILVSSSIHLNVLGSHCFVHSFLSPVVFSTFAMAASLRRKELQSNNRTTTKTSSGDQDQEKESENNNDAQELNRQTAMRTKPPPSVPLGSFKGTTGTPRAGISHQELTNRGIDSYRAHHVMILSLLKVSFTSDDFVKSFLVGFLSGLTCYIRPDVVLIHLVNFGLLITSSKRRQHLLWCSHILALGGVASVLVGVAVDSSFYGDVTLTPVNWFRVNIAQNLSTAIFGKMSIWFYLQTLVSCDVVLCAMFLLSVVIVVIQSGLMTISTRNVQHTCGLRSWQVNCGAHGSSILCLLFSIFGIVFLYSLHGHKEIRFIHDVIIFIFIFIALVIVSLSAFTNSPNRNRGHNFIRDFLCMAFLSTLCCHQWNLFFTHSSTTQWTFQHTPNTQDTNACLEFISTRPDVSGVFIESNIFLTGGMTLLHKDVPVFSRVMNGYFEFAMDSRTNTTSCRSQTNSSSPASSFSRIRSCKSVNTFTRVSNYVSPPNAHGALRVILEKQNYNYLVVTRDELFLTLGFRVVFHHGDRKVLKRSSDPEMERQIKGVLHRLPLGSNSTALLQEGDVLFYMGLYDKAVLRYQASLELSSSSSSPSPSSSSSSSTSLEEEGAVHAYLPLHQALKHTGRSKEATDLMVHCSKLYGEQRCLTPRRMTRLHG